MGILRYVPLKKGHKRKSYSYKKKIYNDEVFDTI